MSLNYREVTKKLREHGCYFVRQGKTSHAIWFSPITNKHFPVSKHKGKDIPKSTLKLIETQSGVKLL